MGKALYDGQVMACKLFTSPMFHRQRAIVCFGTPTALDAALNSKRVT
jgi:hypothetical protein